MEYEEKYLASKASAFLWDSVCFFVKEMEANWRLEGNRQQQTENKQTQIVNQTSNLISVCTVEESFYRAAVA